MGVVDLLKKIFPPGKNPLLAMEPQCVRYQWFTLRLPAGWRFTEADGRSFKASGPGGCLVDFFLAGLKGGIKASDFEKNREGLIQLLGKYILEEKSGGETVLPTGVIWMEAADTRGKDKRLRIALLNPKPRNIEWIPPILQVTCTMPAASAGDAFGAERFEALREALRGAEWNRSYRNPSKMPSSNRTVDSAARETSARGSP